MKPGIMLSEIADGIGFLAFPRARMYRQLGARFKERVGNDLDGILRGTGPANYGYLASNLSKYQNWSYLEIIGQTTLINLDILGYDPLRKDSMDAALASGLANYAMKLADSYVERNVHNPDDMRRLHLRILKSVEQDLQCDVKSEEDLLVNGISKLANRGQIPSAAQIIASAGKIANADIHRYMASSDRRKHASIELAVAASHLWQQMVKQYIPGYPWGNERFLEEQAITAQLLDDIKDFKEDRTLNKGYNRIQLPGIAVSMLGHFYRHFEALPDFKSRKRNMGFIALASLFHFQELMGRKEKS